MRKIELPVRGPRMATVVGSYMYVTSYTDNRVIRMPWPDCDRVDAVVYVKRPRGIVRMDDHLYVACYGNPIGRIVRIDPQTMTASHAFWAFRPRGIAQWRGMILVTEVNRGRVVAYSLSGYLKHVWSGFIEPRDVHVQDDVMWVADTGHDRVVECSLNTPYRHEVARMHRPNGVATGDARIVATQWNSGTVHVISRDGTVMQTFEARTPSMAHYVRHTFLVCDAMANCVYEF